MYVRMVRVEMSDKGAIGVLLLDSVIFCYTLQPDVNDPNRFYLPAGDYLCRRFHGEKWKDTFEVIVPGHTALLFHPGNIEEESKGCTLLGETTGKLKGDRAVLNSGATFKAFMDYAKDVVSFPLRIVDCY